MDKNAGLISELERRAQNAGSLAEGQRLYLEAAQLRRGRHDDEPPSTRLVTPRT